MRSNNSTCLALMEGLPTSAQGKAPTWSASEKGSYTPESVNSTEKPYVC